jgi:hypothetical protein
MLSTSRLSGCAVGKTKKAAKWQPVIDANCRFVIVAGGSLPMENTTSG